MLIGMSLEAICSGLNCGDRSNDLHKGARHYLTRLCDRKDKLIVFGTKERSRVEGFLKATRIFCGYVLIAEENYEEAIRGKGVEVFVDVDRERLESLERIEGMNLVWLNQGQNNHIDTSKFEPDVKKLGRLENFISKLLGISTPNFDVQADEPSEEYESGFLTFGSWMEFYERRDLWKEASLKGH